MTSVSQVFGTMFIASARRSQSWILSSLWCSGFRISHSVVQGTGGHVVPSLGRGSVHLNPAVSIALLFKPRPRPSAVMSQHSRRQINDLVVAADEQRREGCLCRRDEVHKHQRVDTAMQMCAQPNVSTGRAVHSCTLKGHVLGGWEDNQFKCS